MPKTPSGELHEPIGVVQVRDTAAHQERRDDAVDQDVDLGRRLPDGDGGQQAHDPGDRGVAAVQHRRDEQAPAREGRELDHELPHAADEHARGQGRDRLFQVRRHQEDRPDDRQVQHDGRQGRHEEVAMGVQHAHRQRGEPDEEEVGEHHAGQADRQRAGGGVGEEAGRHDSHQQRRRHHAEQRQRPQDHEHAAGHRPEHPEQVGPGPGREVLGEDRDEGGGERPLPHQPPQQVGQPEGHEEGVRRRPGAEDLGDRQVAQEAENPARQGGGANDGRGPHHPAGRRARLGRRRGAQRVRVA
jgi:hypothetical protein